MSPDASSGPQGPIPRIQKRRTVITNPARPDGPAADPRHLLVIGAGPGLGGALARRFAQAGYHLTLLARHTDGLAKLASDLADTGAAVGTVAADASDPEGLRATLAALHASTGAPGLLVYNASMPMPGSLLSSDIARLHQAYDVDVVGAIRASKFPGAVHPALPCTWHHTSLRCPAVIVRCRPAARPVSAVPGRVAPPATVEDISAAGPRRCR